MRRWNKNAGQTLVGKTFLVLDSNPPEDEVFTEDPAWTFLMDGASDWNFEDAILEESDVVSEAR